MYLVDASATVTLVMCDSETPVMIDARPTLMAVISLAVTALVSRPSIVIVASTLTVSSVAELGDEADPSSSWTAQLLAKGPEKCAEKFGEEAVEAIIEAVKNDRAGLTSEAADVLYHLLVMLAARDVPLSDVLDELARRQSTSGIAEKAART